MLRTKSHFGIKNLTASSIPELESWLVERNLLTTLIQQQLLRAQQRMKSQADKNRSEREYQVNDLVYLRLQPYIQTSVASRSNQKLSFKYYGPFRVLQRVGQVAYKLELPGDCRIHPVVHVSLLKKHVPSSASLLPELPQLPLDAPAQVTPIAALDHRVIRRGSSSVSQWLIHWSHMPAQLATWDWILPIVLSIPSNCDNSGSSE